jgi:tetratricopeptide (TPR) repeat protein
MCRAETDGNAEEDLMLRARLLAGRASYMKNNPEAKQDLLEKALAILDKVLEVDKPHLQAYVSKAEVLWSLGRYQEQVDTIEELVAVNSDRLEKVAVLEKLEERIDEAAAQGNMEDVDKLQEEYVAYAAKQGDLGTRFKGSEDLTEMRIQQAEAYIELGEWQTAKDILMTKIDVISTYGAGTPIQVRRTVMGLARCAYELKVFDKAIAASDWAIEMNRHFPGVYKYKALAEKAMGDLDAAIVTMNRAVLYETPWDEENRQKALSLYDELLAEKEKA